MSGTLNIKTGRWTDHSTSIEVWTLAKSQSVIVQAVIPIFVTWVGNIFWKVVAIAVYHLFFVADNVNLPRGQSRMREVARRKVRVVLRNADSPFATAKDLTKIVLENRFSPNARRRPRWRFVPLGLSSEAFALTRLRLGSLFLLIVVSALAAAGWIVAGVFVGYIWLSPDRVTSNVRLQPGTCGRVTLNDTYSPLQATLYASSVNEATIAADLYVKQCYNGSQEEFLCNQFMQGDLIFTTADAACPFGDSTICIMDGSTPVQFLSQNIDSLYDLGINLPASDRVAFRKNTTCSPISSQRFASILNANDADGVSSWPANTTVQRFLYGPRLGNSDKTPYTFDYYSFEPDSRFAYNLDAIYYFVNSLDRPWAMNSTFFDTNKWNADVTMVFLTANHLEYTYQNSDPVFATGLPVTRSVNGQTVTTWARDHDVSVLACLDQYVLCPVVGDDIAPSQCSMPLSWTSLAQSLDQLKLTPGQNATAHRIMSLFPQLTTFNAIDGRGGGAGLLASQTVSGLTQLAALPDNQWRREVSHWFSISLAKFQQGIFDFPTAGLRSSDGGAGDDSTGQNPLGAYISAPDSDELRAQCDEQLTNIIGDNYVNFSWKGVKIVLCVGLLLIVTGWSAEPVVNTMLSLSGADTRIRQWEQDDPANLHQEADKLASQVGWPLLG